MTEHAKPPRKTPCASCPYRTNVPSGIWEASEYEKLVRYDGDIPEQSATAVFLCHQQEGCVCAGWLGHRDPGELLAVRLGLMRGELDERSLDYTTTVPLFPNGQTAAEHGLAEIETPGIEAQDVMRKVTRVHDASTQNREEDDT